MEDRANHRCELRHECLVPIEGKIGSTFNQIKTVDISRHGIGFVSHKAISVNEKIALEIMLNPHTQPIIVVGVVKWVQHLMDKKLYRVGLVFSEVISGSSIRLDQYFSSKKRFEE